jgi:integrase
MRFSGTKTMPVLTDKLIHDLKPSDRSEYHAWDGQTPGFGVRVRKSGHKTYVLYYRPKNRQRMRKLTIGSADGIPVKEARRQAREYLGEIAAGKDPADKRLAYRTASLRTAYEAFRVEHLPRVSPEHARHRERIFERHFLPKLGDKVLSEISRGEIKEIIDRIAKTHRIAASNTHRGFSAFLSWCVEHGLVEHHVLRGTKLPSPYRPRERTLSDVEVVAVWRACDDLPTLGKAFFRMLLASGQRRSEVAGMHWSEINREQQNWTIPAERTKNRQQQVVPLSPLMSALIEQAPGKTGFLFPSPLNNTRPLHSFARPTQEFREKSKVADFRLHDLRRTAASIMGKIGVAPHVIEAILNHKSGIISGIAAIYNKYDYEREKRIGLERYGQYLESLVEPIAVPAPINQKTNPIKPKNATTPTRLSRIA